MTSTTNSKKYKVEKVYFDGQLLTLNEDGFFYVTMPSYPTSFSVETVKINRNFTINKTENLSAYITEKETDTIDQNVSYGLFDTTYYVHTSSINDDFGANGVEVSYVDENGDTQLVTVTQKTRGELYTFKCPAGDVTITVQEKDVSAYKNHEILGTYIGFQYYSYYANRTSPSSTHTITFSSNETTTSSLSARKDGYWRIIDSNQVELQKGTNNFLYTHEKDALVSPYKATNNGGNNESVYLYVRGESGSKITFDGCLSTENDTINWVVSVSLNDTYATTFACINNVLHLNVQVKMLEGTTINGASKFEVSKNDKLIATITNAGSNKLTVVEEKEAIIYTGEKGELSLKNDIALFEEENYSYIIDGNQITLSSSTKEYVLQLDNENLTYTVISFNQKDANPFSGYQFTGYYDDYSYTDEYGNPSQSSLKVTFNEGDTISGKLCAGSDSHWFDFDATLVGTELTLKITNACKTSYIGTSIKATVKNNTITFNQDIDDIYTIAYGVVSCQAFPGL